MPFVLDSSVVSGWHLENQTTDYTISIARRLREDAACIELALRLQCPGAT